MKRLEDKEKLQTLVDEQAEIIQLLKEESQAIYARGDGNYRPGFMNTKGVITFVLYHW